MSVDFLTDPDGRSCLICDTTGIAFGPVFDQDVGADAVLEYLTAHLKRDPRTMLVGELRQVAREINEMGPDEYNRRVDQGVTA